MTEQGQTARCFLELRRKMLGRILAVVACWAPLAWTASPNSWKGLELRKATPESSIQVLGPPKRDEMAKLHQVRLANVFVRFLDEKYKDAEFRVLTFPASNEFKTVKLLYLADRLSAIYLELDGANKVFAKDLPENYPECQFTTVPGPNSLTYEIGLSKEHAAVVTGMAFATKITTISLADNTIFSPNRVKKLNSTLE